MMDIVTSDLCLQVQDILHDAYGERFRPPALLKQRVAAELGGGNEARGLDREQTKTDRKGSEADGDQRDAPRGRSCRDRPDTAIAASCWACSASSMY